MTLLAPLASHPTHCPHCSSEQTSLHGARAGCAAIAVMNGPCLFKVTLIP